MDHHGSKRSLIGVGLIVAGAFMLLARIHVLYFNWHILFWAVVALLGLYKLVDGFLHHGRGVFFGTGVAAVGTYEVLKHYEFVYIPSYLVFPSLIILAGVGFLLTFAAVPRRWHLIIPSVTLIGLGAVLLLAEEGYFSRWEVIDSVHTWWPAALILFGVALLLNRGQDYFKP